ncbi:hypothetical protein CB1_000372021, partial [Camelus ferus]
MRHSSGYLQPRDLPSRGVFPFVRSLLCNTGSRCRNTSYEGSGEHRFGSSRFQSIIGRGEEINDLAFLMEIQDLAEEIYKMMDKAQNLQELWHIPSVKALVLSVGTFHFPRTFDNVRARFRFSHPDLESLDRSVKTSVVLVGGAGRAFCLGGHPSYGPWASAGTVVRMDLNQTEEAIATLERLLRQRQVWDFLLSLPGLFAHNVHVEDGVRAALHLLRAVFKKSRQPPLNPTAASPNTSRRGREGDLRYGPTSPATEMDFVRLSEIMIKSLQEFGFLRQEQVSKAVDTVYALRNASDQGPETAAIHATLTGLRQLFTVDEDFRVALLQYVSQLFNGSVEALLGNECSVLGDKSISPVNYSIDGGSSVIPPWAQILSSPSANGSKLNGFHDWDNVLSLKGLSAALRDGLVRAKLLRLDHVEKFLFTLSNTSEQTERRVFAASARETDIHGVGNSLYQLAGYLALNLSHDPQHPPRTSAHEMLKAVGLSMQLARDAFSSLMPSVYHNIPQGPGNFQVVKKVASLLRNLKKTDIDLLVGQVEQIGDSLVGFFQNVSRLGPGGLGVNLLVDLMEKLVDSSRAWNVNHLLRLSRLFPKDDVSAVVDAYYGLPHAVRLLRGAADKNVTAALKDVYNFTLLHGTRIANVSKEDFAEVIKTLSAMIELISDKPEVLSEALTCLPVFWCGNHSASGLRQNPEFESCAAHVLTFPALYSGVAGVLAHLRLSAPGEEPRNVSGEGHLNVVFLPRLLNQERLTNFSVVRLLFERFLSNRTDTLAAVNENSGDETALLLKDVHGDTSAEMRTDNDLGFLTAAVKHLFSQKNGSEDLVKLNRDLRAALRLVREASAGMAGLLDTLSNSPVKDFLGANRATLEITERLLGVIARAGGHGQVLEPLLEMSDALITLVQDARFTASANDTMKIFDTLYSVLQQTRVFAYVNQSEKLYDLSEEIAGFLSSVNIDAGDVEHLVNVTRQQLGEALATVLGAMALLQKELLQNSPHWAHSLRTWLQPIAEIFINATAGKNITSGAEETPEKGQADSPFPLTLVPRCEKFLKGLIAWTEYWQEVSLSDQSVAEVCRAFQQPVEPLEATAALRRVGMLALRALVLLAENPSWTEDVLCVPLSDEQGWIRLARSLEKTLLSGNPIMTFLGNFSVTQDVKVKDVIQNVTRLTEGLRTSLHISDATIEGILEANVSHSKVLPSALAVALSGRCDRDVLRLLLEFPEGAESRAVAELCGLPGDKVYSLIVLMAQNLNLRNFVYKASESKQARGSAFGSFQSLMRTVCTEQASFLSSSDTFMNLPRVDDLLGQDRDKFNIPEDATPFCLKLYQEILRSPNGALVWSFLKPVLHGKILYTPNTPEINKVVQKANYTFSFVDKLKTLSETLLKMSSVFQGSRSGQMLSQLQGALRDRFLRSFVESQLHIDADKLTEELRALGRKVDAMLGHTGAGRVHFLGRVLVNLSSCVALSRFQALDSVPALESKAQELMRRNDFLASIIFNTSGPGRNLSSGSLQLLPHVTYTLRTSVLYSMRTDLVTNPSWKFHPQSLPADGFKYNYVFVPLQDMIDRAIVSVQTGRDALEPGTQAQAMPYPCHSSDLFLNNVGFFFPLIMMLTWMVSVASVVRKLVYEREVQLEEYVRIMGVHPAMPFLAWFVENMAVLSLSSAALAVVLKASGIFTHSNAFIVFLFLLDFGVSVVMLSFFLSAFFSQANTAALCTGLVYMISFLPYIVLLVLHNQLSVAVQTLLTLTGCFLFSPPICGQCLLSTTAFGQGVFFVTFLEGQETGIQWSNMYQPPGQADMTFGWVCWMLLLDSGIYFLCGWYLSNLIPGTFGLRKPWYFPFTASYWKSVCGLGVKRERTPTSDLFFVRENSDSKDSSLQTGEGTPLGVTLVSVTKEYERHQPAVRDLTLTFHGDQITALLGTNGAGKTTVISLLTGLHAPTSGTILVNGRDLRTDLPAVRRELGLCPQRDVLFDDLTVLEQLLLFGSIKAPQWPREELRRQVDRTLRDVELTQHQHKQTRALSGGLKRKLSIGIAFLGTSRTVVLDEPTSGVDPCSRRGIWDILLKYRKGRTVIFTTHHLDEAEALSDRVAVLQRGQLQCCGPPSSLTEAAGQGLRLTLTKQASLRGSSGAELSYTIPEEADRAAFEGLFQALDQNLRRLRLTGYGLSDATLEEVPSPARGGGTAALRGSPLLLAQTAALLGRRLRRSCRAWRGTLSTLLLPVLFVGLAMALFMVRPLAVSYPPLKLALGHYDTDKTYFFSSRSDDKGLTHVLLQNFGDRDLLCADSNPSLKNSPCWHTDPAPPPGVQDPCGCQVWYNQKGFHALPSYLNHLNNLILWRLLPPTVDSRQY